MEQLTEEQAIAFASSGEWKNWTDQMIVDLQLYQPLLCMDFSRFHKAMEVMLGRPIWTHEFANQKRLRDEYEGKRPKGTVAESLQMLVEMAGNKTVIVVETE